MRRVREAGGGGDAGEVCCYWAGLGVVEAMELARGVGFWFWRGGLLLLVEVVVF